MVRRSEEPVGQDDSWKTLEEGEVTLETLVNRPVFKDSKDTYGHSVVMSTRMPEWIEKKLLKLTQTEGSPYYVISDVIRDAIFLGLLVIQQRRGDWVILGAIDKAADKANELKQVRMRTKSLITGLEELLEFGEKLRAAEILEECVREVNRKETTWIKGKIFEQLRTSTAVQSLLHFCSQDVATVLKGA